MTLFQPSREQMAPKLDKEVAQNHFFSSGCPLKVQSCTFIVEHHDPFECGT